MFRIWMSDLTVPASTRQLISYYYTCTHQKTCRTTAHSMHNGQSAHYSAVAYFVVGGLQVHAFQNDHMLNLFWPNYTNDRWGKLDLLRIMRLQLMWPHIHLILVNAISGQPWGSLFKFCTNILWDPLIRIWLVCNVLVLMVASASKKCPSFYSTEELTNQDLRHKSSWGS